ncbi:decarboxylating NADP(+)-dependent phosphogluconate dehydrogenase [Blochmannia endosymbiont of Polyrhachis (Hedomyrma) turneri]|uniref:decarboxylating NADP(+)-dependent phosphogluconate dehydrogenase n=1 Tax=Blochmannia endosymbiont of Polyrhachis (Hedomyrma) turneri TaxID=1505596 RepID=UPI00061B4783|nr:decarboxylating NADP(+)-dependent phosphogluconate dehydrogenase [Blochmannia endosymbiont of Polyrhachis (Hedomyrma) turneri]
MIKKRVGIVGMGIMGKSLALNFERHGYSVSIFNRSYNKVESIILQHVGKKLFAYSSIKDFVLSLESPRCILIMIQSGASVDQIIMSMVPYLEKGDVLIDGGNSFYKDTVRRNFELFNLGIYFIGLGISGGEFGALYGPAFMPGGQKSGYNIIEPILKDISADFDGEPCIFYISSDGSGHYVKMVHNGIEYADMQLIAESYALLKYLLNFSNEDLSKIFNEWNQGELNSYLIGITKDILIRKNEKGYYLLDSILDEAESKGTGQWISQSALDNNEPLNIITESVFARYLSVLKSQRVCASKVLLGPSVRRIDCDPDKFIEKIRKALYLSKIMSYAQGFSQLRVAANQNNWNLNFSNIAKIFRAGCIIRAQLLQNIVHVYKDNPSIINLLLAPYFKDIANFYQESLRDIVICAIQNGVPVPAFSAAIEYYDSYRSAVLPANLIQAQRDYFGAHGYKCIDNKDDIFHANWL